MAAIVQDSPFIKHLASSDKDTRDQALESLRAFLGAQTKIAPLDLLKLWKGLFYCLWMQDKPALQQRLARDLASLVGVLKEPVVLPFLRAFWETMAREWGGIEALRMDKYLYLVRVVLGASWRWLERDGWKTMDKVEEYVGILEEIPLNATNMKIPDGLKYHMLDIYLDELEKVGGEEWNRDVLGLVLQPVSKLQQQNKVKSVRRSAKEVLDDDRLKNWRGETLVGDGEMAENGEDDEWGGIED